MSDKVRSEFEAWCNSNSTFKNPVWIESAQEYDYTSTQMMWQAWQASRAALVVELPQENCDAGERLMNQVRDNLDAAGVKYNV